MLKSTMILLALFVCNIATGQKAVSTEILSLKANGYVSQQIELFKFVTAEIQARDFNLEGLSKGTIIDLDKKAIQDLFQGQNDFITVVVPVTNRTKLKLTLKRHEIFTPDFKLFTSSDPDNAIEYTPGIHYMGIVEDDPSSLVALSVFRDQIMAMIATDEGNFIIGPIEVNSESKHIFYNDRDLDKKFDFECGTEDDGLGYTEDHLKPLHNARDFNDCVRLHIEIDHNVVLGKGGALNATNFVTGMFNQSFVIYANASINMVISEMKAWTTPSPYVGSIQSEMLASYKQYTEFFNGDISQLITYSAVGGSAAGTSGLCNGNPDLSKCFSHIDTSYSDFPAYSWTVFVITHENGHLLGSSHTHSCVWNGNNTAIDGCYTPAGACPQPPIPPAGGTIMSYCYLASSGSYIDFNLGFGPQPLERIQNSVYAAENCLSPCGAPTNYCGANGVTSSAEFIDKVVLGAINNLSGNNGGYGNFTSLSTTLNAGNAYTMTLTPKFTGGNKTKYWRVWIDLNNDFDWYDSGELLGQGSGNNTISLTITVPANTISTTTRMRLAMKLGGYATFCGTFSIGEVEDYTVNIVALTPTCSDGILNQGETGIDCGGPCPSCPTCSDGIQNQGEYGIDCGGPCPSCPVGNSTVLLGSYFETGMDGWIDGGPDVSRENSSNSYEGLYSIRLADNSGAQSAMTSPVFDFSSAVGAQISFHFYMTGMELSENVLILYNNGSGTWSTIGDLYLGTPFQNNLFYSVTITIPNFMPTSSGSFRIQCDASDNSDQIFIDAVTITRLNGTELIESGVVIREVYRLASSDQNMPGIYPNPTQDVINLESKVEIQNVRVIGMDGRDFEFTEMNSAKTAIDISQLPAGIYFLIVRFGNEVLSQKFIKI